MNSASLINCNYMRAKRHRQCAFSLTLLLTVFSDAGCASLKPSASVAPPDQGGGLKMCDEGRDILGVLGYCFYFAGDWLSGWSAEH